MDSATVAEALTRRFHELDFSYEGVGLLPIGPTLDLPGFWPGELGHQKRNGSRELKRTGEVVLGHNWGDQDYYDKAQRFLEKRQAEPPFREGGGATGTNIEKLGIEQEAFLTNAYPGLRKKGGLLGTCGIPSYSPFDRKAASLFQYSLQLLRPRAVIGLGLPVAKFLARLSEDARLDSWRKAINFAAIDSCDTGPVTQSRLAGPDPITVVAMTHPSLWSNLGRRRFEGAEGVDACRAMVERTLKTSVIDG